MSGVRPGHDLARKSAAVMIERHVEELGADARGLPGRTLSTAEQPADTREARRSERRPAQQTRAKDAERDGDGEFAPKAGKGGDRERHHTAADLDHAGKHNRIGCTKHLQQGIENDYGEDTGNQGRHGLNIVRSAGLAKRHRRMRDGKRPDGGAGYARQARTAECPSTPRLTPLIAAKRDYFI